MEKRITGLYGAALLALALIFPGCGLLMDKLQIGEQDSGPGAGSDGGADSDTDSDIPS